MRQQSPSPRETVPNAPRRPESSAPRPCGGHREHAARRGGLVPVRAVDRAAAAPRLDTAGDLARVPAGRITGLRGIGCVPRYELVRLSREWRQRFNLSEWTDTAGPLISPD